MSDYIHPSELQATLAAISNVQECFSEMYRICTHTIAEQRRICAQLLQILDTPIRLRRRRQVWTRPGRTSLWWDKFVEGEVDDHAWRENFRMSKDALVALSEELRPYIEGQTTNMRAPVDVLKKVASTLYYLSCEGQLRKTANAFGLSRSTVSVIIRQTCRAITSYLGPKYIRLPFTVPEVEQLVSGFQKDFGMPQCLGAVDGTHIEIKQPAINATDYINRKGKYSLNVEAVCDHKYR